MSDRSHPLSLSPAPVSQSVPTAVEMQDAAEEAAELLRALANRDRILILCYLAGGEKSVSDLEHTFGVRQPTMSQRLAKLREAGLVETRRDGKTVYYRLTSPEAARTITLMYDLFGGD